MTATWVDLGDGQAIDASRVGRLEVDPPWPPSVCIARVFTEQLTWTVHVLDSSTHVVCTVGMYWAEAEAREHARRIVGQMLQAASL